MPTLLDWLVRRYPSAKRQTLKRMVQAGRVQVNGLPAKRLNDAIGPADTVVVAGRGLSYGPEHAEAPRLRVVYEDDDLLVADKPAGLLTSTVPREKRPTLLALVRRHCEGTNDSDRRPRAKRNTRVGLIHRLDRDASGLLMFSKSHDAYRSLKRQFFDHTVERVYTAVVEGVPSPRSGRIESRLLERADGTVYSTDHPGQGEHAATEYEVVEKRPGRAVLRVKLHTGRKHQIRVHLSERGTPIVGDPLYRREDQPDQRYGGRLLLAATKLSFDHPRTGERMTFELPVPNEFL